MFLQFRPVHRDDFEECFRSMRNRFAFEDAGARDSLLRLWRTLLSDGRMIGAVMDNVAAPRGERIVWLCFKVFASDDFAAALIRGELPPLPSRQLLDAHQRGEKLPLLSLPEIRWINSHPESGSGLNMLVTHYGSPFVLGEGSGAVVVDKLLAFTEYFSSGYNVKEILEEFYDDYNGKVAMNAGFCPRTDYARHYEGLSSYPPLHTRPRLLGMNRGEALDRTGTIGAAVFSYQKPKFGFRPAEQEMLVYALLGETDEVLSDRLCLAEVTVRKRWEAVYARVSEASPAFFDETYQMQPRSGKSMQWDNLPRNPPDRKREKKRTVLAYLRHHMEELRPLEITASIGARRPAVAAG